MKDFLGLNKIQLIEKNILFRVKFDLLSILRSIFHWIGHRIFFNDNWSSSICSVSFPLRTHSHKMASCPGGSNHFRCNKKEREIKLTGKRKERRVLVWLNGNIMPWMPWMTMRDLISEYELIIGSTRQDFGPPIASLDHFSTYLIHWNLLPFFSTTPPWLIPDLFFNMVLVIIGGVLFLTRSRIIHNVSPFMEKMFTLFAIN